jgi:hypothetical protein
LLYTSFGLKKLRWTPEIQQTYLRVEEMLLADNAHGEKEAWRVLIMEKRL